MPHVFISYAWADGSTLAQRLHQSLNELDGWSAWMDTHLHADTVFSHELQGQIDRADVVLVVISPEVNRRDPPSFVQREMVYATQSGVDKPVFAARAANCPVPLIIAGVTYQDFFGAAVYEDALAGLVEKIRRSPRHVSAASRRERELVYLRQMAQEHGFWGKIYVDTAAEAHVRPASDPAAAPVVPDPDIAAYLGEIVMAIYPEKGHSPDDDSARETVENFAALTDALARFERVAIIGDPGSGKTTTLRRLAYNLADKAALDGNAPLPVFVPLGGYTGGDLDAYIARHFDGLRVDDYLPDRTVVLLDGLNETAHENVAHVQAWLDAHATARVMLTCRKLDYVERKLPLQRVDVLPLDLKRIRQFMTAYKLTEQQCDTLFWELAGPELKDHWDNWQRQGHSFDDFWSSRYYATGATSGLLGLAQNPFLLTMTIGIFTTGGEVPRNRGELFTRFVKGLFEQRGKPAAEKAQIDWVDEQDQHHALAELAYQMQAERRGTRVPYVWAQNIVAKSVPKHDPDDLLYLAASSGIIEKGDQVRFVHQLLQEFFAAHGLDARMKLGIPARRYWPRKNWWKPHDWEETALLLAGLYNEDCTPVLEWLQKANPELAGRCVTESGAAIPTETLERLRPHWVRRMVHGYPLPGWLSRLLFPGMESTLEARAAVGRGLAPLGDPRPGVLAPNGIPEFAWCKVPAGPFRMGGDPDAWRAWKGREFKLDYLFWIAKYPVTYAQYTAFVEAGGYRERRYWTEAGWRNKGDRMAPYLWNDPEWHIANHPVIGVSWYEAYACTQWLDELRRMKRLALPSAVPANYVIRLARECEWEKAARFPDGRKFPWGNAWDPARLNSAKSGIWSGIGRTSAVGLFPQGANPVHGACDLSGNVWEWCLTAWAKQYQSPETEKNDPQGVSGRCARGGSWLDVGGNCRAAARLVGYLRDRFNVQGFRVVVSVPI